MTSGSLGHGVGVGVGLAYAYKNDKKNKKVYVIISEGELYEGSTWEALQFASHYKLDNLNIILDITDCFKIDDIKILLNKQITLLQKYYFDENKSLNFL